MKAKRFYPESDDSPAYVGRYTIRQPRTYYVFDCESGNRVYCESRKQAVATADMLNDSRWEGDRIVWPEINPIVHPGYFEKIRSDLRTTQTQTGETR